MEMSVVGGNGDVIKAKEGDTLIYIANIII